MKKNRKLKVGILIIELLFTLLYFSIQFGGINLNINDETIRNKNITPISTAGNSVLFEWNRTWGGNDDDYGNGVTVDSSGNVYLVGTTYSFGAGDYDIVLVKYDGNGLQQWNRTWGGANDDYGEGVALDSLCNVYIAGHTRSFGAGIVDMVLVKYDSSGVQQWNRTWGGSDVEWSLAVVVDLLGNVYLAGSTYSFGMGSCDMVLIKYDGNGVQQWNQTWDGGDNDYGRGVAMDLSGNVYLAGSTFSFGAGDYDMVLVKYDGNGVQQWNRTWGEYSRDDSFGVAVDSSGKVYLGGCTGMFGTVDEDMVLVKYDENGVQQWNRTWVGDDGDIGYGIEVDSLGNVYLGGCTGMFGTVDEDMVLVKYDGNGVQQWNRTWGGADDDCGFGVAVDSLGNIYLAGYTYSFGAGSDDMVLVKYSNVKQPPSDEFIMILIIVVSIVSAVGVGIAITYFIRKRRKIVE